MAFSRKWWEAVSAGRGPKWVRRILFLGVIALFVLSADGVWRAGNDSATHLGLARNLAQGKGYVSNGGPHTLYPPLYPLMLSLVEIFFGTNIYVMQMIMCLSAAGFVAAVYLLVQGRLGPFVALGITAIIAFSLWVKGYTVMLLSEMPFAFFSTACLVMLDRAVSRPGRTVPWLCAIGFAVAAYLTRDVGLALVPAVFVAALRASTQTDAGKLKRLVMSVAVVTLLLVPFAGWKLRSAYVSPQTVKYSDMWTWKNFYETDLGKATFQDRLMRLSRNASLSTHRAALLLGNRRELPPEAPFYVPIGLAVFCGFLFKALRRMDHLDFYALSYALVCFVYPFDIPLRFLLPVFPLMLYYVYHLVLLARGVIPGLSRVPVLRVLAVAYVIVFSFTGFREYGRVILRVKRHFGSDLKAACQKEYLEIADHVRRLPGNNVLCRKPSIIEYFSGKDCYLFLYTIDVSRNLQHLEDRKIDLVVVEYFHIETERCVMPMVEQYRNRFTLLVDQEEYKVFAYNGENADADSVIGASARRL